MTDQMLKDLQALVECESPSSDLDACAKVLKVANKITAKVIGTSAEIIQESGRPVYWLGSKNPEVVLLTHLDTVWPIGSFTPLWRVDGDVASGPGVFDMKSGFIQALYAMRGQDLDRVALIATTDEETGSATSRKLIEEVSKRAKAVLVMEASLDGKLKIGRKGTSMYQITIHGRAAHAGLEPEKGINATVEISKIVSKLIALENKGLGTSVVPTVMTSGSTTNTVPALASLDVDSRSFTMAEMKRVEQAIRALKPENDAARIEITGGINRPPMETSSSSELYELAEKVAVKLAMAPLGSASVGGASDGNFAAIHTKVLDGLGSLGGGAHANNEHVLVSHLEPRSNLIAALIKEILL